MDKDRRDAILQFARRARGDLRKRQTGPCWLRSHAVDAVTTLEKSLDHIEAQEERIQELTNKVIYLKELPAENRNIAIAAVRAIEKQEVDRGRYGEKLRHTLMEAGYLDAEERE